MVKKTWSGGGFLCCLLWVYFIQNTAERESLCVEGLMCSCLLCDLSPAIKNWDRSVTFLHKHKKFFFSTQCRNDSLWNFLHFTFFFSKKKKQLGRILWFFYCILPSSRMRAHDKNFIHARRISCYKFD